MAVIMDTDQAAAVQAIEQWCRNDTDDIITENGNTVEQQRLYRGCYDDHIAVDKNREARDYFDKRGLVETDWGYRITAITRAADIPTILA